MNKNIKRRDGLLNPFFCCKDYSGGIKRFDNLNLETLENLVKENFVELDDQQNNAPSIAEMMNFMIKYPKVTAHGYAVDVNRPDYRISLEGLNYQGETTNQMIEDFSDLFEDADEFEISNGLFCWYS
jgi:hypothetical protein